MNNYQDTTTWKKTLGKTGDKNQDSIDKLRSIFLSFRDKVSVLAGEIARSLPEFTVHDISHIDALWEMADCICGEEYELNPVEGFILGGSFLLHDVAMSLSAFPDGLNELEKTQVWKDTVTLWYKQRKLDLPKTLDSQNLTPEAKEYALATVLRKKHASVAEQLVTTNWMQKSTNETVFLIDDAEIRMSIGRIIGKIAHSHWWDINRIDEEFSRPIGALGWCPREWTIDPLKISCILRVADASHIDSRRAPSFLRSLRNLNPVSDSHWSFQEKLQKPFLTEDSLNYSSGYAFPSSEASAWWLCYDALKMIDRELRQTDALLADKHMQRFQAKRVFGIESPERLASLIQTHDWSPIDAFVHIGDLPKIIRSLGGEELYGKKLHVPIRELIQNSSDAIRARRSLESRSEDWGEIKVTRVVDGEVSWLEVEDNGLGMTLDVIKNYLFEFGSSYWNSELMQEEHPGLLSKGVEHTGKYGIGFFSIFMLGDNVTITTRQSSKAQDETFVIEFREGLNSRPIIRKATQEEYLVDGGTRIKVAFDTEYAEEHLFTVDDDVKLTLEDVCLNVAPALDIKLRINDSSIANSIIPANFWLSCDNEEFLDLLLKANKIKQGCSEEEAISFKQSIAPNVRILKDENENVLGRILLLDYSWHSRASYLLIQGCTVVNGLRESNTLRVVGILKGINTNAARNDAQILATKSHFKDWIMEQAELIKPIYSDRILLDLSQVVKILSNTPSSLPIARTKNSYLNYSELAEKIEKLDEFSICTTIFLEYKADDFSALKYVENMFFLENMGIPALFDKSGSMTGFMDELEDNNYMHNMTNVGYICEIISKRWKIPLDLVDQYVTPDKDDGPWDFQSNKILIATTSEGIELKEEGLVFNKEEMLKMIN